MSKHRAPEAAKVQADAGQENWTTYVLGGEPHFTPQEQQELKRLTEAVKAGAEAMKAGTNAESEAPATDGAAFTWPRAEPDFTPQQQQELTRRAKASKARTDTEREEQAIQMWRRRGQLLQEIFSLTAQQGNREAWLDLADAVFYAIVHHYDVPTAQRTFKQATAVKRLQATARNAAILARLDNMPKRNIKELAYQLAEENKKLPKHRRRGVFSADSSNLERHLRRLVGTRK
jgi:hypothetical protein